MRINENILVESIANTRAHYPTFTEQLTGDDAHPVRDQDRFKIHIDGGTAVSASLKDGIDIRELKRDLAQGRLVAISSAWDDAAARRVNEAFEVKP